MFIGWSYCACQLSTGHGSMNMSSIAAVAALGIAVSGCATIVTGTSQSVAITTPPTTGAECVLSGKEGNRTVVSPGATRVEKSKEDIAVHCSKPGWQDAEATIPSHFQGWTFGNIAIGGLIGAGVDAATGAMHKYPRAFEVPMMPNHDYNSSPGHNSPPPSGAQTSANDVGGAGLQRFDQWQGQRAQTNAVSPK
jgi:hypothetical protein